VITHDWITDKKDIELFFLFNDIFRYPMDGEPALKVNLLELETNSFSYSVSFSSEFGTHITSFNNIKIVRLRNDFKQLFIEDNLPYYSRLNRDRKINNILC
jgi:hypothetical protein